MGAVLNSVMEDIVKSFAGNSFKKQTVLNAMKNRGVTDAELEASGMKKFIQEYKGEKIPVDEMNKVIQQRTDKIGVNTEHTTNPRYSTIREKKFQPFDPAAHFDTARIYASEVNNALQKYAQNKMPLDKLKRLLLETSNNTSKLYGQPYTLEKRIDAAVKDMQSRKTGVYQTPVYTKGAPHGITNHFAVSDYYSHVRYTDVPEGNQSTRYVHELQSDVHQGAKDVSQHSDWEEEFYASDEWNDAQGSATQDILNTLFAKEFPKAKSEFADINMRELWDNYGHSVHDLFNRPTEFVNSDAGLNWITANITKGDTKTAKVIQNQALEHIENLAHTKEQWAIDNNINTVDKVQGFQQDENYLKNTVNKMLVDAANEGKQTVKVRIAPDPNLARSEGIQQWYENDVKNTLTKQAKKIGSEMRMTDDGYAEIPLPEKDFKLPMYSAAGLAMIGATTVNRDAMAALPDKIRQARDAGYSDDEIKQHLSKQYEPNVIDRATQLSQPEDTSLHITVGRPQADQQQQGVQ